MAPFRVIEAKRDGAELSADALRGFLRGYLAGEVAEYQMSAFLMAAFIRGLNGEELEILVHEMLHSGTVLDLSDLPGPRVDKHSTGGIGDKVSLVLAPLAAELGMYVPMMSGRGLGHTGGTLDKLESIPGFRTGLDLPEFVAILRAEGFAMIGQTEDIAPLDRRLYALRSVTGTVPSLPLIASSIMSKKLAEGLSGLVLDVKVGSGAFLPRMEDARSLATTMVDIGARHGVQTVARFTAMDRPLGVTAGNALEVREAVEALRGGGPEDLREVTLALVVDMLGVAGIEPDPEVARALAERTLDGGRPLERFLRVVERQGGDPRALMDLDRLPRAPVVLDVTLESGEEGWVRSLDPRPLGYAVVELGGGRKSLGDRVDPSVGFEFLARPGDRVSAGDLLGRVHAAHDEDARVGARTLRAALTIGDTPPDGLLPLVGERVRPGP